MPDADPIEFECPRCHAQARAATYGPCPSCRAELVAVFAGEGRTIDVERYEPKMNVVPNQVATKE